MSYTPTEWNTGDIVTAEKLNKLENGVASGGIFIVNTLVDEQTLRPILDKTWQEIKDAFDAMNIVILIANINSSLVIEKQITYLSVINSSVDGSNYECGFYVGSEYLGFSTSDPNGYPKNGDK